MGGTRASRQGVLCGPGPAVFARLCEPGCVGPTVRAKPFRSAVLNCVQKAYATLPHTRTYWGVAMAHADCRPAAAGSVQSAAQRTALTGGDVPLDACAQG